MFHNARNFEIERSLLTYDIFLMSLDGPRVPTFLQNFQDCPFFLYTGETQPKGVKE